MTLALPPDLPRRDWLRVILFLLVLTLVRELLYLAVTPAWMGPDEPGHFEYVALLYKLGRIPTTRPNAETIPELTLAINRSAQAQHFEYYQPPINIDRLNALTPPVLVGPREAGYQTPTYYALLLPFYALVHSQSILVQYYTLALVSVWLGLITVLAVAMAVRAMLPGNAWAQMAIPLLVSFWPNQSYMATRINNDNMVTAVGAVIFWVGVVVIRRGPRPLTTISLLALLALAAYTKGTAVFLLVVGGLAIVLGLARFLPERLGRLMNRVLAALGVAGAGALLLAWYVPGVATRLLDLARLVPGATRSQGWIVALLSTLATGQQWQPAALSRNGIETIFILQTFWATYGWSHLFLPDPWYIAAVIAVLIAIAGWLKLAWPSARTALGWQHWQWQALALCAVSIPVACLPLAARMVFAPFERYWHGRILLPLLMPVATLLALGWYQWIPARWRSRSLLWLLMLLVLVEAAGLGQALIPGFY